MYGCFLTVALASCKLTAHICLWTVSSQNNEDTATKAMQVQINACSLIKLMLSYDCKSEDVESNRNRSKLRELEGNVGTGWRSMQSWQKCWFARNLAETYLQLSKKMKIWLAGSTKDSQGKWKSGEKAL
jgi:hypothetical protein